MEFKGQYLSYEEYKALGGTLDLTPFNLLEIEARREINLKTQNRLLNIDINDIPQEVKVCEYNLINSIGGYAKKMNETSEKGSVASESIDGYSVTFITPAQLQEIVKTKQKEINQIIYTWLVNVVFDEEHLVYTGVR